MKGCQLSYFAGTGEYKGEDIEQHQQGELLHCIEADS
jgi:hypothetical protein